MEMQQSEEAVTSINDVQKSMYEKIQQQEREIQRLSMMLKDGEFRANIDHEKKNKELEVEKDKLKREKWELTGEKVSLKEKIRELERENDTLKEEKWKLAEALKEKRNFEETSPSDDREKISELLETALEINKRCIRNGERNAKLSEQKLMEKEHKELHSKNERLKRQLQQLEEERDKLRYEYDSLTAKLKKNEQEISSLKGSSGMFSFFPRRQCEKCPKLEGEVAGLQGKIDILEDEKKKLESNLSMMVEQSNREFKLYQGNTIEADDATRLYSKLFVDTVDQFLPRRYNAHQKLEARKAFCQMFMVARHDAQRQLFARFEDHFKPLFVFSQASTKEMEGKQRLFAHILSLPELAPSFEVPERLTEICRRMHSNVLPQEVIGEFLSEAMKVNEALIKRAPPYIIQADSGADGYDNDLHEEKFVRGFDELQPQQRVAYLRPVVYHNAYSCNVLIKGQVVPFQ